ncbi:MAG: Lrp/AsnC family transcriptional regulator [Chloroflexi bacterium]|nr:Lrp/AsnC family transcriptional regulator [Chloroflexota bacterium]
MDEIDNKLAKLLEQDAWQRSAALAMTLHISPATIRRRLRRLIQSGELRAVAIADFVTPPLTAVIGLNVTHQELDDIIKTLSGLPEVTWFATTTGQFDIIALAQFHSTEELHRFLQRKLTQLEGIKDSETFVCLHVEKGKHMLSID